MTDQCSPVSDPKILAKLLRAIAGGENAKASSHDVIFMTAADWLDRIDAAQAAPTREQIARAIHDALGGDGWAYSNYGGDEWTGMREELMAAADAVMALSSAERS